MVSLFHLNQFNNVVLSSILIAFPLAVLTPPPAHAQISFKDVNFGVNIQSLLIKVENITIKGWETIYLISL
jgi:hypothetical protein